jgi:hypothetical protein
MNLYLDDNRVGAALINTLRRQGHTVVSPRGLLGVSDARHLRHAVVQRLAMVTGDSDDFRALHELVVDAGGQHPGILLVHYDNDARRDMKAKHIARAIAKLEQAGLDLSNQVVILNHWR